MQPLKTTDRNRVKFYPKGESLTHQSMKDDCDINRIMMKYQKTGVLDHAKTYEGQYADFSKVTGDYQEHMNAVLEADQMFLTLPSSIRKKFDNDPGQFLAFVDDPSNAEEMIELGLRTVTPDVIDDPSPSPKKAAASAPPQSPDPKPSKPASNDKPEPA